jgi:DNA polymerase-3 subunit gamma/tau
VLDGALANGTFSHAYLFAGSRGTGKTSIARILARSVGCTDKDFYEIDAASNRGIDDIRELRDAVTVLPFESPYKVYIIDEVHMLTKEAFNALLKTLEEPPSHAIFILATTEYDKLPDTVISRCQTFQFKKPSQQLLRDMIQNVATQEGYQLDAAAADLIALIADGSFRDAHGILQKVFMASAGGAIANEDIEQIVGAPRSELMNRCVAGIDERDAQKALSAIHEAVEQGVSMRVFLMLLLHKVRVILLIRYAPDMAQSFQQQFTEEDYEFLQVRAQNKETNIHSQTLNALLDAQQRSVGAAIPQLPLELAIISISGERQ